MAGNGEPIYGVAASSLANRDVMQIDSRMNDAALQDALQTSWVE